MFTLEQSCNKSARPFTLFARPRDQPTTGPAAKSVHAARTVRLTQRCR